MESNEIAASWGWERPNQDILELADLTTRVAGDHGKALVQLELLDAQQVAVLTARVAADKKLLDLAAHEHGARIQPHIEKVHALCAGTPFYEQLESLLQPHPDMLTKPALAARCEELDCALMLIESTRPVIVFSTFQAMVAYRSAGRAEKINDPLQDAFEDSSPLTAVGSRDDISSIISVANGKGGADVGTDLNVWYGATKETKNDPVQREAARLLDHAITVGATDISLAPRRDNTYAIRLRKFGRLIPSRAGYIWSAAIANPIITMLESKSGANPERSVYRTPRDGHISYRSPVGDAFIRASFVPLNHVGKVKAARSVSMRLFSHSEQSIQLSELGIEKAAQEALDDAVRKPHGLVLVVGPMNSGKSTLIAGAIGLHHEIYGDTLKRVSVEEPIERFIAGLLQVNVPAIATKQGGHRVADADRFNEILRGLKRHDVNTFWIGEVRDAETAEFCVTVSSSGHLAFSTLHAQNTTVGFDVLAKMVRPDLRFQLGESISVIVSQRLLPALCPTCKGATAATKEEKALWQRYMESIGEAHKLPPKIERAGHRDAGCAECENGYRGYVVVNEVLPFTRAVRDAAADILEANGNVREARQRIAQARTLTLAGSAHGKLRAGLVDLPSVVGL